MKKREVWASRVGLIFAAAGNAIGLGNLLRFPSKVALYGGGAFMIPYFVALFLLGIPLMVLEWVIGRYAGSKGHGSMTGIMGSLFHHANWARVLGSIGVAIPFLIVCYYIYIESWTLGFAVLSLFGQLPHPVDSTDPKTAMQPYVDFFKSYTEPSYLAIFFLIITLAVNWYILQRGVVKGIELTAKVGIPALLLMGIFLAIVSLSIRGGKGLEGLLFIYTPDFSRISDPQVWLEASGQIFFTLSLGMGAIATYASYVKAREDVLKTGLWTAGLNEFVEVLIGASIAIPAAFAMFGALAVPELAKEGTFRLGFMSMPAVLMALPLGWLLSAVWFFLLFIAALTSSLALTQPLIALFEDEMRWSHKKSVNVSMLMVSTGAFLSAYLPGFIDEVDFWAGTFMLVFFALVEIIVFVWIFGVNKFHHELTRDVFLKVPKPLVYFFAIVSPIFFVILLYQWGVVQASKVLAQGGLGITVAHVYNSYPCLTCLYSYRKQKEIPLWTTHMKEIKLSQLATGIPKIEYNLGIKEALKAFEEYGMYDFLVVVMDNKPIGIVNKLDLVKAQHREHLTVGDIAHPLTKLREATLKPEHLTSLLDFFKSCKLPILLVDKKAHTWVSSSTTVVLYQASLFKEATIPMFQKLRSLFGHEYYFYCFYIRGLKEFMEEYGSSKAESLQRVLYEAVKTSIHGDVSLSYEENEVYALSKVKLREEEIMNLYMEFQREFSLLYSDVSPVYLLGYCIPMKNLKNFEEFFRISSELKKRMEEVYDASCFIFHEEKPSVVLCEYERRELIHHIKSRIKQDFESIVESIKRTDRDLWEFTLYDFFKKYPYFELFYIIGENGLQVSNNVVNPKLNYTIKTGKKGADRSEKEYFKRASHEDVYISNIYISQATDDFCITVSKKFSYGEKSYVLAGDINYREVHKLVKGYAEELKADR